MVDPWGDSVKLVVTSLGVLVVLAWALHELVHLHDVRAELDARA
jgi:hypothetical protein